MFTVLITTHNRPMLLERAVASLARQTYREFSVVCIADHFGAGFPEETLAKLNRPFLCVTRNGEAGPAASRNIGLKLVETDYFMFLDDDDTMQPDHLAAFAEHLSASGSDLAYCDFNIVNELRWPDRVEETGRSVHEIGVVNQGDLFVKNRIPNGCVMFKTEKFSTKRSDHELAIYDDWDFLLRCLPNDRFTYLNNPSINIHKTPGQVRDRRGARNVDRILQNLMRVYGNNPAPNEAVRQARIKFVRNDVGIDVPIDYF